MKPAQLRSLSVALAGIAALLRAGVSAADALREGAGHAGTLRSRIEQAADRTASGIDPAVALGEALPTLKDLIGVSDAMLPDRLERVAAVCVRRYGLARRLRAASCYPVALVLGLGFVAAAVWYAQLRAQQVMAMELNSYRPSFAPLVLIGLTIVVVVVTALAIRRSKAPAWVRVFPGSRVYALSTAADFLAMYGLYRDAALADLAPEVAKQRIVEHDTRRASETSILVTMRALADRAPDPGFALRDAVDRLDHQAGLAARRFALSMSAAMLIIVALGVLGIGLSGAYLPILDLATLQ